MTAIGLLVALDLSKPDTALSPAESVSGFFNATTLTVLAMRVLGEEGHRPDAIQLVLASAVTPGTAGFSRLKAAIALDHGGWGLSSANRTLDSDPTGSSRRVTPTFRRCRRDAEPHSLLNGRRTAVHAGDADRAGARPVPRRKYQILLKYSTIHRYYSSKSLSSCGYNARSSRRVMRL